MSITEFNRIPLMEKTDSIDNKYSSSLTNSTSTPPPPPPPPPASNGTGDEAEGIWSADIEQSFLEALAIYPPCGRRKIILTDEGKMYGRNELVARYIKIRTGKIRTRKQVSSHLQVLAKRRSKEIQDLRNDKQAQKIILDRIKRYTSTEIGSMDMDDKHKKQKSLDTVKKSVISNKNRTHAVSNNTHSNTIRRSSINIDQLKVDKDTFSTSTNNVIVGMIPSQIPMINKSVTKKSTSNSSLPNMMNNSITHFLPTSPLLNPYGPVRSRCSSDASSLSCGSGSSINHMVNYPLILPLAKIGDENFRLYELSAFIELKRTISSTHSSLIYPYSESCSIYQHDLLRLHANDIQIKNLHTFETISIDQIFDKFPHHDGLKDLFERNPNGSFLLIKFWADVSVSSSIINSMINRDESFFTSYTYTSSSNRPIHISTRLCSFGKQVLEKVEISEYPQRDQFDQFIYRFDRSPLCDYMVQFIQKLRSLPNTFMMNSVLENFTVLQVIKCRDESERLLLCLAFVFEIAMFDGGGPQYQVYKLVAS